MPTPMIDPIIVCELEVGKPRYHVVRFQRIAATESANTIAKPDPLLTFRVSSTGSSVITEYATAPELISTPIKFQIPDHTTATCGSSEWV